MPSKMRSDEVYGDFNQPDTKMQKSSHKVQAGSSHQKNDKLKKFMKGTAKALGVIQVVIAQMNFFCGIAMMFERDELYLLYLAYSFCGSISFIISGSLSIAAGQKSTCLVQGSLATNFVSSIFSGAGIILLSICIIYTRYWSNVLNSFWRIGLVILSILEFCTALSFTIFVWKASCSDLDQDVTNKPADSKKSEAAPQVYQGLRYHSPDYEEIRLFN
ncbi:membrane-spanning 4-domains subfamily A member 4A-like [Ornithorhynchus anatinus]|uniref:membrane-spanning 4-domains subfamily A member 4A-like n=1 Tax=Ornithorhynchus anatinus TaxID=9258 RepID=UPI0010A92ADD|nr:membrane-spanning 4-domains subfamily A member 4A-like [Ornithorhynchus anatinus]